MGSKKASTSTTQNVTTETVTEIRDIGLTGEAAVAALREFEAATIERERIASETLTRIAQETGATFRALVGGEGPLVYSEVAPGVNVGTPNPASLAKKAGFPVLGFIAVGAAAFMFLRRARV